MFALRLVVTTGVVASILWLGWLTAIRNTIGDLILVDELLAIAPAILFMLLTWWSFEPIERRVKEAMIWRELHDPRGATIHAPLSRIGVVWHHTRHALLIILIPLSAMFAWGESLDRLAPVVAARFGNIPGWAPDALRYVGTLVILILTPLAIRFVWNTIPIGPGSVRDQALAVAARYRVKVRGPLLWRTQGSTVNAAILGIVYPFRYMLFTDALLERLPQDQVEGVIAHEVAHVKLRHMLWQAVTVLASAFTIGWFLEAASYFTGRHPAVELWGTVTALGGTLLIFGMVSRRFEWQADAFALRHLSGSAPHATLDAAQTMVGALGAVATLNGLSITRFGFRHGSILTRQRRLRALVGTPLDHFPIDAQARAIKALAITSLAASLALTLFFALR